MYHVRLPAIVAFLAFMTIFGLLDYYVYTVIRKHRARLDDLAVVQPERARSWFTVFALLLPFCGFGFGFMFFTYKTFESLLGMIFK
jgi:hypothetical protein